MNTTIKIVRYELSDVLRGKWVVAYGAFFWLVTDALLRFGGGTKALLSLVNVVLLLIPLVSLVFGTTYLYHARAFNMLLLTQPVSRRSLFAGLYAGLALPLATAFAVGVSLPFAYRGLEAGHAGALATLLACGVLLTGIFTALAFWVALRFEEKIKGLGAALVLWLAAAVLYDGAVLLAAHAFAAYPLEQPMLVLMVLNPIDLARVLLLMALDASALMGYTGAVFERFFGSMLGAAVSVGALGAWLALPLGLALGRFRRQDF